MKKRSIHRLAAALTLAATVGIAPVHAVEVRSVDVTQALAMKSQGALLLDVREPGEYASGHAPGSVLIPVGQLDKRLKEIQNYQNKPVAVICRSGRRSAVAAEILRKAGFTDARNVEGGMMAWEKDGLPVARGTKQ